MNKVILFSFILILLFSSCSRRTNEELLLGKWILAEKESTKNYFSITFYNNQTATIEQITSGLNTVQQLYEYHFTAQNNLVLLEKNKTESTGWQLAVLKINDKELVILSKGHDSTVRTLKRIR